MTKPTHPDLSKLREALATQQPAELHKMDEALDKLRAERSILNDALSVEFIAGRKAGAPTQRAMELQQLIEVLDRKIDGLRYDRDQRRLELSPEIDAIARKYLDEVSPQLLEAARLVQDVLGVMREVDRFLIVNRPAYAGSNLAGGVERATVELARVAEQLRKGRAK